MNSTCFISCIFGKKLNNIKPAPDNSNSFFFTNNPKLKRKINMRGWKYIYVNKSLTNNFLVSSLQSKYIKFLVFLDDFPEFKSWKRIIYLDSTYNLIDFNGIKHIRKKSIEFTHIPMLVLNHDKKGRDIEEEIKVACKSERYKKNMHLTKTYFEENNARYSDPIFLTGLIIYNNINKVLDIVREVYDLCMEHKQPQCQLYFAAIFNKKDNQELFKSLLYKKGWFRKI